MYISVFDAAEKGKIMRQKTKLLLLIVFLGVLFAINSLILKDWYNSCSLYGSYLYKAERAAAVEGEKFIIIGGSASNLGFDSQLFEKASGKPAVNMAISAGVPLRVYFKAAEIYAKPGDTIILPLEYSYLNDNYNDISEAYIDMVGVCPKLKCRESFLGNIQFCWSYFLRSFTKANDCFMFALKQKLRIDNTIYIAQSVDSYGDFVLHKDRKPTYQRAPIEWECSYDPQTLYHIRAFIDLMKDRNVTVYISYPPMDEGYFQNYKIVLKRVQEILEQELGGKNIIGTPFDFLYGEECFFDTCYHLQYEYREQYTHDLYREYGETMSME